MAERIETSDLTIAYEHWGAAGLAQRQIVAQTGQRTVQAGTARIAMKLNRTGGQAPPIARA
ncbi:MAG TPA: hypothetical protein VFA45_06930 [Actinomycetes bacterium]|nr:hypothetical protein [Actinomycetes bacterium]